MPSDASLTESGKIRALPKIVISEARKNLLGVGVSLQKTEQEHVNLESAMTMLSITWTKGKDNARRNKRRREESLIPILLPAFILFLGLCCPPTIYFHPKFMLSIDLLLLLLLAVLTVFKMPHAL